MAVELHRDRENWGGAVWFVKLEDGTLLKAANGEDERFNWDEVVQMRDHGVSPADVVAARKAIPEKLAEPPKRGKRG